MVARIAILSLIGLIGLASTPASAQEPQWSGSIIAVGQQRTEFQSTDILERPYRPLHFYGNTARRRYYRGQPLPLPRDFFRGMGAVVAR